MPAVQERPPVTEEQRLAVAGWIQSRVRPVERLLTQQELQADPDAEIFQSWEQEFEDKEYQIDSWSCLWEARQRGEDKALLHLATGLGKTTVGVLDFLKFSEECRAAGLPEPRGLFLSHQDEINDQAMKRFLRFMPDLKTTKFATRQQDLPSEGMTFANLQGMRNEYQRFDPTHFDYIIVDEAHHAKADTYEEIIRYFTPKFKLGLTATPDRLDGRDISELFGEAVYSKGLAEAIARGWLADVDYHIVFDDIVKEIMEGGFMPGTLKEMHDLFNIRPRNEAIAKNVMEERHRIGLDTAKTIVFCESIEHAKEMAGLLDGVTYHSDLNKEEKAAILGGFRTGDQQVICAVDMFNEGIDIPDARLIVFLRSTNSEAVFLQQFGRGARRIKGVKEVVSVLDFVANIERIEMVRKLSESIQRHAREVGQRSVSEEEVVFDRRGDELEGAVKSLRVHSQHGEFEFDRLAVDLLERWGEFRKYTRYTKETLIEQLSIKARELGRAPKSTEVNNDPEMASTMTFYGAFETGSWNDVLQAVGLSPNSRRSIPINELKAQLLDKAARDGHPPTATQVKKDPTMASDKTFLKTFGMPWKTMLKYLGLAEGAYTADELKSVLQFMTKTLERAPRAREVDAEPGLPPASAIMKAFNVKRWNEVIAEAGLGVTVRQSSPGAYTEDSLREQFLQKAAALGRAPSHQDVSDDPEMPSVATYKRVFKTSWDNMIEGFGLAANPKGASRVKHTEDSLREQLLRKAEILGRTPYDWEVNDDPEMASVATYRRVFRTSWNKMVEGFGLTPNRQRKSPDTK